MTMKLVKTGLLLIAAVMIVSIAFAGAASAVDVDTGSGDEDFTVEIPMHINPNQVTIDEGGSWTLSYEGTDGGSGNMSSDGYAVILELDHLNDSLPFGAPGFGAYIFEMTIESNSNAYEMTVSLNGTSYMNRTTDPLNADQNEVPNPSLLDLVPTAAIVCTGNINIVGNGPEDKLIINLDGPLPGSDPLAIYGIIADKGGITISNATVEIHLNNSGTGSATALYAKQGITINPGASVQVIAEGNGETYGIRADDDSILIQDTADIKAYANSTNGNAMAINASKNITIDSSSKVTATAESAGDNKLATGLYSDAGDIIITNAADVKATANQTAATGSITDAYAMYAKAGNVTIDTGSSVETYANSTSGDAYSIWAPNTGKEATKGIISIIGNSVLKANAAGPGDTYALYAGTCNFDETKSCDGRLIIDENSEIEAIATSSTSSANPILVHNDIMIGEGTVVNATALSDGDWAFSIYSRAGNITISDANTVNAYTSIQNYTADDLGNSFAIYADGHIAVDSVGILNATSDALGEWHYSYAMSTGGGPVTIIDSPDVTIHAYSDKADSYALTAGSVEIESSIVNATVTTETNYNYITAIETGGRIHISDSIVSATAAGYCPYAIASWNDYITIDNQSTVDAHAIDSSANGAYALYSYGDISVINSTLSELNATSNTGDAYAIWSFIGTILIANSTINNLTSMCESGSGYATAICGDNFFITDSILPEIKATSDSGRIDAFWGYNGDISSSQIGKVTAYNRGSKNANVFCIMNDFTIADSTIDELNSTSNSGDAFAISTYDGDLIIGEGSIIRVKATGVDGYAMVGGINLTMVNPTLVSAIGTTSAFAYYEDLDIDSLEQGYSIVNATYPATSIGFTALQNDWNPKSIWEDPYTASNYTSVLIAKEVTVALDANGGEGGSASVNATYGCTSLDITNPTRSGYTLSGWFTEQTAGDKVVETNGDLVAGVSGYTSAEGTWINTTATTLYAQWKQNSQPYTPSHKESGQTQIQQQVPVQDVSADPTPANQATADVSASYKSQSVLGTSASDVAAIKQVSAEAAAQMEIAFASAEAAGIPLTNSKGAKAVVVTSENIPGVEKVTFSRVYEISPANAGEKLTKVTVKVPKSDITSKGLTPDDVTVYHFLEAYNIWQPLETISMTQDAENYYYTAATDGTSPFGVLVKKIGSDTTTTPTTQPTQTQKSPAPFVGIIAGLGAAALLMRMRK